MESPLDARTSQFHVSFHVTTLSPNRPFRREPSLPLYGKTHNNSGFGKDSERLQRNANPSGLQKENKPVINLMMRNLEFLIAGFHLQITRLSTWDELVSKIKILHYKSPKIASPDLAEILFFIFNHGKLIIMKFSLISFTNVQLSLWSSNSICF